MNDADFPHSPTIYGCRVETYGPYSQDYMRSISFASAFILWVLFVFVNLFSNVFIIIRYNVRVLVPFILI